jgi:hypothetical protein
LKDSFLYDIIYFIINGGGKMNKEFKLEYELTSNDYYKFNKWYNLNQTKKFYLIVAIIFLGLLVFNIINSIKYKSISNIIVFLLIVSFLIIYITIISPLIIKIRSKKIFKEDKLLKSKIDLILNDKYINEKTKNSNLKLEWNDLHKIIFLENYIYLMIARNRSIIIPKKELKEEILQFIKIKENKLSETQKNNPS